MKRTIHIAACCIVFACGCSREPEQVAVKAAFDALIKGLERGDTDMLWALADDSTRKRFEDLAHKIVATDALIEEHLSEDQRDEARTAIGRRLLGPAGEGRELFKAILDPDKLAAPQDPKARQIDRIEVAHNEARLFLDSDEVIAFTRASDGTWRTRIFLQGIDDLPGIVTLRDNLATVRHNVRVLTGDPANAPEEKVESPDKATPPAGKAGASEPAVP